MSFTDILAALELHRFWITVGFGIIVLTILALYIRSITSKREQETKARARRANRKSGQAVGAYEDGPGMPLDDDDDGEYRDSDLYGNKGKKRKKDEYFQDWD